jgi:D-glycero-D-manno-heptose 1,7-bisphosphate phosphatase
VSAKPSAAVFLDRDGVLNRAVVRQGKPYPPESIAELELLPRVPEALRLLRGAGFRLFVVTNQPDVGSGKQTRAVVEKMHASLRAMLPLDDIRVCYHVDADGCPCRKPKPGMLLDAARDWGVALVDSVMIGDRWRDIEAGKAAGCRTILVGTGYDERRPAGFDVSVPSLIEASQLILSGEIFRQERYGER